MTEADLYAFMARHRLGILGTICPNATPQSALPTNHLGTRVPRGQQAHPARALGLRNQMWPASTASKVEITASKKPD